MKESVPFKEHVYSNDKFTVALVGPNQGSLHDHAIKHGADPSRICVVKAASGKNNIGFQHISEEPKFGHRHNKFDIYSEGVILTEPGSASVISTADCLVGVFHNPVQKWVLPVHAGRPAMTPINEPGEPIRNIINIAYEMIIGDDSPSDIEVYFTGSICGHCFVHDNEEAEKLVEPFDQFGPHAFTNRKLGALNLVEIAKQQLIQLGVLEKNIKHDDLCTMETPWLASYRQGRSEARNAIVTVRH